MSIQNDDKTWSYDSELRTIMSKAVVSMKQQRLSIQNFDVSNDYACAFAFFQKLENSHIFILKEFNEIWKITLRNKM